MCGWCVPRMRSPQMHAQSKQLRLNEIMHLQTTPPFSTHTQTTTHTQPIGARRRKQHDSHDDDKRVPSKAPRTRTWHCRHWPITRVALRLRRPPASFLVMVRVLLGFGLALSPRAHPDVIPTRSSLQWSQPAGHGHAAKLLLVPSCLAGELPSKVR